MCSPLLAGSLVLAAVLPNAASETSLLSLLKQELRPSSYLLRSPEGLQRIADQCALLEAECVTPAWPRDLMALDGRWRLVYSSSLALSLPGMTLPEPVFGALESFPLAPRKVEQEIDVVNRRVVNRVSFSPSPPEWLLTAAGASPLGGVLAALPSAEVELDHSFSVGGEGGSSGGRRQAAAGSVVELRLERLRRKFKSNSDDDDTAAEGEYLDMLNPQVRMAERRRRAAASTPPWANLVPAEREIELPGALASLAAGSFDTPYVSDRVRISRGTGGVGLAASELRVFERIGGGGQKIYASWQEEEDALAAAAAAGEELDSIDDRWQEGGMEEAEAMDYALDALDDNGMPDS